MGTSLKDTNFYLFATTFILTFINFLMYLTNRSTFNILYEKPKILNIDIQGQDKEHTYIGIDIINPSSFSNHIIKNSLKRFISRAIIYEKPVNAPYPSAHRETLNICIQREISEKYKNKYVFFTLTDIKGRKTRKYFRFKNGIISY
jgi:hypothetical protein